MSLFFQKLSNTKRNFTLDKMVAYFYLLKDPEILVHLIYLPGMQLIQNHVQTTINFNKQNNWTSFNNSNGRHPIDK